MREAREVRNLFNLSVNLGLPATKHVHITLYLRAPSLWLPWVAHVGAFLSVLSETLPYQIYDLTLCALSVDCQGYWNREGRGSGISFMSLKPAQPGFTERRKTSWFLQQSMMAQGKHLGWHLSNNDSCYQTAEIIAFIISWRVGAWWERLV